VIGSLTSLNVRRLQRDPLAQPAGTADRAHDFERGESYIALAQANSMIRRANGTAEHRHRIAASLNVRALQRDPLAQPAGTVDRVHDFERGESYFAIAQARSMIRRANGTAENRHRITGLVECAPPTAWPVRPSGRNGRSRLRSQARQVLLRPQPQACASSRWRRRNPGTGARMARWKSPSDRWPRWR
jgi:hypothetical protein